MSRSHSTQRAAAWRGCLWVSAVAAIVSCGGRDPITGDPGVSSIRRLTESEYRHSIADVFGEDVEVRGRFEPDAREHGLNAIGTASLAITPAGFEQYYAIASSVAAQALDDDRAPSTLGCSPPAAGAPGPADAPGDATAFDEACARRVLSRYGRRLLRRSLEGDELATYVGMAREAATTESGTRYGVRLAMSVLMASPDFLFRVERTERDPEREAHLRLDGYSKATRLSYLLWNTTPDDQLLAAAESGALHSARGLRAEVERLVASPRLEAGVRALFGDLLQLDRFSSVTKDGALYPKFSQVVARSAQEETLRTVVDHLLAQDRDYRELFTTNETFIDRSLAAVYRTAYRFDAEWSRYTFAADQERAGIVSQISFLTLHSHPGESSPTKRGVAINEIFRCEETPDPPANVDFSIIQDTENPTLPTRRKRLLAHAQDPSCRGCHTRLDPLGLPLDRFDALGQYRPREAGDPIDVTLELGGATYDGAPGLGQALATDPQVSRCFVDRVYGYATGHWADTGDRALLEDLYASFVDRGHRMRALLVELVTHPDFFRPAAPSSTAPQPAGPTTPDPQPTTRATATVEPTRSAAPPGSRSLPGESASSETTRSEAARWETARLETARSETAPLETAGLETAGSETAR